jgi:hypothetical protein
MLLVKGTKYSRDYKNSPAHRERSKNAQAVKVIGQDENQRMVATLC